MGINNWTGVGNLTRDPELRTTQSGKDVCNFSIAINERFKSGDEWKERAEYINIVVWGNQAKACSEYLHKGKSAAITGSLQTRKWEDRDGNTRYTTEINAREVQFLGGEKRETQPSQQQGGYNPADEGDLPF